MPIGVLSSYHFYIYFGFIFFMRKESNWIILNLSKWLKIAII